jgi:hypothetical protein
MPLDAELQLRLASFDKLPLECDGMTRVMSFVLREVGVAHVAKVGRLLLDAVSVAPVHYWIELEDGVLIDYRARLWAAALEHVPHGIFRLENFPRIAYVGEVVDLPVPRFVFEVLTRGMSAETPSAP